MAPMISVSKAQENEVNKIYKDLKNQKAKLVHLREYIEKTLNMLEKIFQKSKRNLL